MEEQLELQEERTGLFSRVKGWFNRNDEEYEEEAYESQNYVPQATRIHARGTVQVTVRRLVQSFQDAVAAADGLKRGEQQILNLSACDESLRTKIKDFMCGVNYSEEGTWEELGEHVYLLAPPNTHVEVAPATPRMQAAKN